jgi:CRP/FNR family transcriptional regulator, cyclic AMP receptor protein
MSADDLLKTPASALLAKSVLFSDCLSDGSANGLVAKLAMRRVAKDCVFFRKGDAGNVMFAIATGMVRISTASEGGREVVLGILREGDLFGEISLLDGKARAADAVAMTDCSVFVLQRQDFLDHLAANPEFAFGVMQRLARRLRSTDAQVEDAIFLSLPGRIAKNLLHLARDYGSTTSAGVRIQLKLSQQELANLVGVTRESVNRILVGWMADGMLGREGRYFVIFDMPKLERLAAC